MKTQTAFQFVSTLRYTKFCSTKIKPTKIPGLIKMVIKHDFCNKLCIYTHVEQNMNKNDKSKRSAIFKSYDIGAIV